MSPNTARSADGAPANARARGKADRKVRCAGAEDGGTEPVQQLERQEIKPKGSKNNSKTAQTRQSMANKAGAAGAQEAGPAVPTAPKQQLVSRKATVPTTEAAAAAAEAESQVLKAPKRQPNSHKAAVAGPRATNRAVGLKPVAVTATVSQKKSASREAVVAAAAAGPAAALGLSAAAAEDAELLQAAAAAAAAKPQPARKSSKKKAAAAAATSKECEPELQARADAAAITVTVATWNVKHFTCVQGTAAHLEKLRNIAQDIVRSGADIVVLQEVDQDRAVNMLCAELMRLGALNKGDKGWCYALSNPLASGGYAERAAFVWRHGSRVRLVGVKEEAVAAASTIQNMHGQCSAFGVWEGSQPDHASSMGLKRAIYTGKFSVCTARGASKAQLHLNSVHIDCGQDTTIELGSRLPLLIEQMWEGAAAGLAAAAGGRRKTGRHPFFAVLGDFNRDAGHSCCSVLQDPAGCRLCPLLRPGRATNLSGSAQYDNAWVPLEQRGSWSEARVLAPAAEIVALPSRAAVSRYSDHRLVYMVLTIAAHASDGGRRL